ncbi:squalene/phytoene synthase family protein [Nocardia flavorosea]|nr:squalene/phytoene synthase family protein [Nocardia flavorosea]
MVDDIVDTPAPRRAPAALLDSVELALRTAWSPLCPPWLHGHSAESRRYSQTSPLDSPRPGVGAAAPFDSPSPSVTAPSNSAQSSTPRLRKAQPTAPRSLDPTQPSTTQPLTPARSGDTRPLDPGLPSSTRPLDPGQPSNTQPLDPGQPSWPPLLDSTRPGALPAGFGEIFLALTDTVARFAIDPRHFWSFLDSMRMDAPGSPLFRNRYPTMAALEEYMRGSAAAIGLQLLPVLGTAGPRAAAEPAAAALGNAFQLTNFLRDIGEDLDRDRIYLPADELAVFGVDEELLRYCRRTSSTDRRVRRALAHLIAVNRDLYRRAHPGIELLSPRVRPGIRTAATLYAAILGRIEESGYDVFARRAVVPNRQRLWLAATAAIRR